MLTSPASAPSALDVDRGSLLELDLHGKPDISLPPVLAAQPVQALRTEAAPASMARDLAKAEVELAQAFGIKVKDVDTGLFFKAGTELMDVGTQTLLQYARDYKAMPTLSEAAKTHEVTLASEKRETKLDALCGYRIDGTGMLREVKVDEGRVTFGPRAVAVSAQALSQITGYYPHDRQLTKGAARRKGAIADQWPAGKPLPPAANLHNGWLGDLRDKAGAPVPHKFRTRHHRGRREMFAVFSGGKRGYTEFDTDKILWEAAKHQANLKVKISYDADSTTMRARCTAQAPVDIAAFNGVGRVHQIGFDLRAADDGSASISCTPFIIRVRCINATLVQHTGSANKFRHVGSYAGLKTSLEGALATASAAIGPMQELWAKAAANYYTDGETGANLSPREAIERMVLNGYLPTCGVTDEDAISAYVRAWEAEDSPQSAQGIVMAVQRAAHEGNWRSRWAEDEIEESASNMLYQPNYQLWAPESDDQTAEA